MSGFGGSLKSPSSTHAPPWLPPVIRTCYSSPPTVCTPVPRATGAWPRLLPRRFYGSFDDGVLGKSQVRRRESRYNDDIRQRSSCFAFARTTVCRLDWNNFCTKAQKCPCEYLPRLPPRRRSLHP